MMMMLISSNLLLIYVRFYKLQTKESCIFPLLPIAMLVYMHTQIFISNLLLLPYGVLGFWGFGVLGLGLRV